MYNLSWKDLGFWGDLEGPNDLVFDEDVIHIASGSGRVYLMTLEGDLIGHWMAGPSHGMWLVDRGDIYLAMLSNHERLRKYVRV